MQSSSGHVPVTILDLNEAPIEVHEDEKEEMEQTTTESFLKIIEKQGNHSSVHILEHSVNLLKKLIMLSASNLGVKELPDFLKGVLEVEITTSTPSVTSTTTTTSTTSFVRTTGRRHFKHNKFASFYRQA